MLARHLPVSLLRELPDPGDFPALSWEASQGLVASVKVLFLDKPHPKSCPQPCQA